MAATSSSPDPENDVVFVDPVLDTLELTEAELVEAGRVPLWRQPGAEILPPLQLKVAVMHDLAAEPDRARKAAILARFVEGLGVTAASCPRSREAEDVAEVLDAVKAFIQGERRLDRALTHAVHAIASAFLTALSLRGLDEALAARAVAAQLIELGVDLPDGAPGETPSARLMTWREHLQEGRFSVHLRTIYKSALALSLTQPRPASSRPVAV
jgi:hypothetical protein